MATHRAKFATLSTSLTAAGEQVSALRVRPARVWGGEGWRAAFTLVELLVSMTILLIIMVAVVSMVNQTSRLWRSSSARAEEFQGARAAFESMTRKLSQATLNTYWDYSYPDGNRALPPTRYVRQSELHFISGQAAELLGRNGGSSGNTSPVQSHAVFFQAPLGYTVVDRPLNNLLNACGYYLEFGSDLTSRPNFLKTNAAAAERFRYRLMELQQPSEALLVYNSAAATQPTDQRAWFITPVNLPLENSPPVHVLAENVLALIIQPRQLPSANTPTAPLAPDFRYDSRVASLTDPRRHQLPPLVDVMMIAVDEPSAILLDQRNAGQRGDPSPYPKLADANGNLWDASKTLLFQKAAKLDEDLANFENNLVALHINYRVFRTTVSIRGARWSE